MRGGVFAFPRRFRFRKNFVVSFAPDLAEELWRELGHEGSIHAAPWPEWDAELAAEEHQEIAVAIDGRTRVVLAVRPETAEEEIERLARELPAVCRRLESWKGWCSSRVTSSTSF